jgi:serine/threonine protein kinase/tetratricopeptide (TPR) repeat protein
MLDRKFGKYELIRRLGRGGMADVYLARDTANNRDVALKLVELLPDRESRDIFDAERRGAMLQEQFGRIDSHVPRVHEYGTCDGHFYIDMEYVDGEDLAERIARGPIAPDHAAAIAADICDFLQKAHSFETTIDGASFRGIIHGDIKPKNIRINRDGQVKVLDFGIAKGLSLTRKLTRNDFGSLGYLSPERLDSGEVDVQSDCWSVGVLLYEMLAGAPPFDHRDAQKLEQLIRSRQMPPSLPGRCPAALVRIVCKMLAPSVGRRYAHAAAMLGDLQAFRMGEVTEADRSWLGGIQDDDTGERRASADAGASYGGPAAVRTSDEETRRTAEDSSAAIPSEETRKTDQVAVGQGSPGLGGVDGSLAGAGEAIQQPTAAAAAVAVLDDATRRTTAPIAEPAGGEIRLKPDPTLGSSVDRTTVSTAAADADATRRTGAVVDAEATRRTTAPIAEPAGGEIRLKPDPTLGSAIDARTSEGQSRRKPLFQFKSSRVVAGIVIGLVLFAAGAFWNEMSVWGAAREMRVNLATRQGPTTTELWDRYEALSKRSLLGLGLTGLPGAVKERLVSQADQVIADYRQDAPAVREAQWQNASECLTDALRIDPGDRKVIASLRYCEGHLARINGEARVRRKQAAADAFHEAVARFEEAARFNPRWPDPYLGLARTYIYGLDDIDKANDALEQAERLGYKRGNRELVQLADGYRRRGTRMVTEADAVKNLPQEADCLQKAADDFRKAIDLYGKAIGFGDSSTRVRQVQAQLDAVTARLDQLNDKAAAKKVEDGVKGLLDRILGRK